jgi:hypothetical protein
MTILGTKGTRATAITAFHPMRMSHYNGPIGIFPDPEERHDKGKGVKLNTL